MPLGLRSQSFSAPNDRVDDLREDTNHRGSDREV